MGRVSPARLLWQLGKRGSSEHPALRPKPSHARPFGALLGLSHLSLCLTAFAQTPLRLELPAACGSEQLFLAEVSALSGSNPADVAGTEVRITGDAHLGYELSWAREGDERTFRDPACDTLFRTAVVITAAATTHAPEPSPRHGAPLPTSQPATGIAGPSPAPPQPETVPVEAVLAVAPTARMEQRTLGFFAAGGGGVTWGLTPQATWGAEVLLGVQRAAWSVDLGLRFLPPHSATTEGALGLRQWGGGARVSFGHTLVGWVRVSAGLAAYWIRATGIGVAEPRSDQVWMVAPEAEVATKIFEHHPVRLELAIQGRRALLQPRFDVEPATTVYQVPPWGLTGLFRIVWGPR